jgi:ATP-dependent Clp protease adaptor protein ClpS
MPKVIPKKENDIAFSSLREEELVLYNDDINSFDFVIESLIEVCQHNHVQAEQCALIAHFKGKCPVKQGILAELVPLRLELNKRGLTVTIE